MSAISFASLRRVCACVTFLAGAAASATAAPEQIPFDDPAAFDVQGRALSIDDGAVYLDAVEGEGVAWLKGVQFENGRISIEVQGADRMGKSFVGLAFHASAAPRRHDVVYVRPFNFRAADPLRRAHALQYMALPDHDWEVLRKGFPGKYEAEVTPAPGPADWVRLTIEVHDGKARVFVNDQSSPALSVDLLNTSAGKGLGLWVGNNSDGKFRHLRIERATTPR
jgi:hypothetical protein